MTIVNGIKYAADFILSILATSASNNNYKQFPLPLAIAVCVVALVVVGALVSVGIMLLVDALLV